MSAVEPGMPDGLLTERCWSSWTEIDAGAAPVKPVPITVMVVSPDAVPVFGLIPSMTGVPNTGALYVNLADGPIALVPPAVLTVTSTGPAAPGGTDPAMVESPCA